MQVWGLFGLSAMIKVDNLFFKTACMRVLIIELAVLNRGIIYPNFHNYVD